MLQWFRSASQLFVPCGILVILASQHPASIFGKQCLPLPATLVFLLGQQPRCCHPWRKEDTQSKLGQWDSVSHIGILSYFSGKWLELIILQMFFSEETGSFIPEDYRLGMILLLILVLSQLCILVSVYHLLPLLIHLIYVVQNLLLFVRTKTRNWGFLNISNSQPTPFWVRTFYMTPRIKVCRIVGQQWGVSVIKVLAM